ncbi:MAG: hypothetical protein LBN39_00725 [Planctomycetaceae bacterium]|jgi:hypothetical protein|nr:hypothetical protein [Planctomycetaceae bacterium]
MDTTSCYIIAGIAILTFSLFRYQIKRKQREVKQMAERKKQARLTAEAEQKRQQQLGEQVRQKTYAGRATLPEPVRDVFTGGATPKQILKWELEIDEIGRRMLGQLDTKMSAIQAMLLEANRTANRIEILLETLEKYKNPANSFSHSGYAAGGKNEKFELSELEVPQESVAKVAAEESKPVTVLREIKNEPATELPGLSALSAEAGITDSRPLNESTRVGSHFDSLFSETNRSYRPIHPPLELKKQIETLADYGYEARQIAQNLNITVGEVDFVLSLRE